MPTKRARKTKKKSQDAANSKPLNISKSQMRKRRKLEEEKERSNLLTESLAALEKYKLPNDKISLLQSTKTLSRNVTAKEKRRVAIQFAKAGLQIPPSVDVKPWIEEEESNEVPEPCFIRTDEIPQQVTSFNQNAVDTPTRLDDKLPETFSTRTDEPDSPIHQEVDTPTRSEAQVPDTPTDEYSPLLSKPFVVHVHRPKEVQTQRLDLPIIGMEQEIMEAVNSSSNHTVLLCGQTGCGKTTQVPQFLYEAGFGSAQCESRRGMIGITQPRRVAVLTTAKRVAYELGFRLGNEVGFQVRYDKRVGEHCSMKFMTDGILLREVQSDILLRKYSVIILDEVHERSVNTDILVGMLSRVVKLRQKKFEELKGKNVASENMIYPLKLILMSATLRIDDFVSNKNLFREAPPVIDVEGRQYDVVKHYSKRTDVVDYTGQAFKKVMFIHKNLPRGAVLVFVTGQREVEVLCSKLRKSSSADKKAVPVPSGDEFMETDVSFSDSTGQGLLSLYDEAPSDEEADSDSDSDAEETDASSEDDVDGRENALASLKSAFEALEGEKGPPEASAGGDFNRRIDLKMRVLPLYAMLPAKEQLRVYDDVAEDERLIVVATNVAETSLTIPGIRYVVDTGREKVKNYNPSSGVESYDVQWISKASANQRAGRAGRTGAGHCYRLYSQAVFENVFPPFSPPEITKLPVDSIVLVLKSMGIDKVENFPFPTPPEASSLLEAERCLKTLQALDGDGRLTALGTAMAKYPMSPRHSCMLLTVIHFLQNVRKKSRVRPDMVLGYAIAASAALSHQSPFQIDDVEADKKKEKSKACRDKFFNPTSDALTVAHALQCYEQCSNRGTFCNQYGLHFKIMEEMSKLRRQIVQIMFHVSGGEYTWSGDDVERAWGMVSEGFPLSAGEECLVLQGICCGWADKVARKLNVQKKSHFVEYELGAGSGTARERVFLHRSSSVFRTAPQYVAYSEIRRTKRLYLHWVTMVRPEWLPADIFFN